MERNDTLSLIGLALRGGRLEVGEDAVRDAARMRKARLILVASDAADRTRRDAEYLSRAGDCLLLTLPHTKAALGAALGRGAAAIAALTDIGLAEALGRRLAAQDPETYGAAAERLAVKAKRARERQAARKAARTRKESKAGQPPRGKSRPDRPSRRDENRTAEKPPASGPQERPPDRKKSGHGPGHRKPDARPPVFPGGGTKPPRFGGHRKPRPKREAAPDATAEKIPGFHPHGHRKGFQSETGKKRTGVPSKGRRTDREQGGFHTGERGHRFPRPEQKKHGGSPQPDTGHTAGPAARSGRPPDRNSGPVRPGKSRQTTASRPGRTPANRTPVHRNPARRKPS